MSTEIVIQNLNQYYGKKQALNQVNLKIEAGMFGLLGRNGAGKTTLMKVLATLLPKTEGNISVCGIPIKNEREIRRIIGYLPQDFSMYANMSVYEAMDYLGVLSGLSKNERKERIPMLLQKVNLMKEKKRKVKALSGGMKRRLGIAQAILHDPKVLIVDEPTAGLDPEERVRFRNLLSEIAQDRIVLLSTHIVGDIEATCEKIAILEDGQIIYHGTVLSMLEAAKGKIYSAEISSVELPKLKEQYPITSMLTQSNKLIVRFIAENIPFQNAVSCEANVEDAYMYLLQVKRGEKVCF
ncbi:MAG: yxlF 7 [Herbinix sp.]|jgi:ABC-2 type transport system ATP-binding protein|nr:yxlF 7 [Herbinix sp.]